MTASDSSLSSAIAQLPAGRYAVGVSGGADSVALLHLLHHQRPDLYLHVAHLDHQTRGQASTDDGQFVADLAKRWALPCTLARRDQIEPLLTIHPANRQAFFRALRHALFAGVVAADQLDGVLLAHHADDQAETILQRLVRGSSVSGLGGMSAQAAVGGMPILRPLLNVSGRALRTYLQQNHQPWREDASNQSRHYQRNRTRQLLRHHRQLTADLLQFQSALADLRQWTTRAAPVLPVIFAPAALANLPAILAEESARRWLLEQGIAPDKLSGDAIRRLIAMAGDAASPSRQHFPNHTMVRRRRGVIFVEAS